MRAAAYTRYSTDKQDSTSVQLELIRDYCAKNNLEIVRTFSDEAKTGTNTEREGYQNLLAACRSGVVDAVVIYDISRGSRDVEDWFGFRKEMSQLGIQVFSVMENLGDITDASTFLVELVTVGMGHVQVLQSRQKSMDKIKMMAKEGLFCGGVPNFGYDIVKGKYVINELEAIAVRKIYGMFASGYAYKAIVEWLAENGFKGKRGRPFGKNSVYEILRNPRYKGQYFWNTKSVKKMHKFAGRKPRPDGVRYENGMPAIVSVQLFEEAQMKLDDRRKHQHVKRPANRTYLLTGLLKCDHCGGSYVGSCSVNKYSEYRYYTCANKKRRHDCHSKNVPADELEVLIVTLMRTALTSDDILENSAELILDAVPQSDTFGLRKELYDIECKIDHYVTAIGNGFFNETLGRKLNEAEAQKKILEEKINAFRPTRRTATKEEVMEQLRIDANALLNETESTKDLLHKYINAIIISDSEILIDTTLDLSFVDDEYLLQDEGTKKYARKDTGVSDNVGSGGRI